MQSDVDITEFIDRKHANITEHRHIIIFLRFWTPASYKTARVK